MVTSSSCTHSLLHLFPLVASLFGHSLNGVHMMHSRCIERFFYPVYGLHAKMEKYLDSCCTKIEEEP